MAYGIGLDVGIASVGWAVLHLNSEEEPDGIIDLGSRIFDKAEKSDGSSLAKDRREKRSLRRRTRRRKHRKERIQSLLVSSGLLTRQELEDLYDGQLENIYALRVRALDEAVSRLELARILMHISQRRGFKSNRVGEQTDEEGLLKKAISENSSRMKELSCRTVAELFIKDERFAGHKRNRGGEYIATMSRELIVDEVHAIFKAQRGFGTGFATEELEEKYITILTSQRSFDEGPGQSNAKEQHYGSFQALIGPCTLFKEERRAAKATWSFEYFALLDKLNNIRLVTPAGDLPLNREQRQVVIALAKKTDSPSFAQLRKALELEDEIHFNMVYPSKDQSNEEAEKKEKLKVLHNYHAIRKALDKLEKGYIEKFNWEELDAIGETLTLYKSETNVRRQLAEAGLEENVINALCGVSVSGFGHISVKACKLLIPHLERGLPYSEACAAIGKDHRGHEGEEKQMLIRLADVDYESVTSPVVRRAVSQCLKVVNAIIRKQGQSPVYINIELAREMAKSKKERDKLTADNLKNQKYNDGIREQLIKDFHISKPSGQDIVKLKLWQEQDCRCAYSLQTIEYARLMESGYCEIDHIVPYSISFDDTYKNKVLVLAKENRDKGNRLPLQYLSGEKREQFIVWTKLHVKNPKKRELLLKERITDEKEFKERHLQDTKTISVFLRNLFEDKLLFAPSVTGKKKRVTAVNGAVTDMLRKRWGIKKIREDGDLHHAVDAVVVACTTDGMIRQLSRHYFYRECEYVQGADLSYAVNPDTGEVTRAFPYPWPQFRKELEIRVADDPNHFAEELRRMPLYALGELPWPKAAFVSRMPNRKVSGAAHEDTVRSPKAIESGVLITKTPLTDLKIEKGEIKYYYEKAKQDDPILYEALKNRLLAFGGDAKAAFSEPFHKPKKDGTDGPVVKKVQISQPAGQFVPLNGGKSAAKHTPGSMVRADVYFIADEGYYFVPVYIDDTKKAVLHSMAPIRKTVKGKQKTVWIEMKKENFCFSLYPKDLLYVCSKALITLTADKNSTLAPHISKKSFMLYFEAASVSTGSFTCITHDNSYKIDSLGIKTLLSLEKYTVDMLGEYHKVEKEQRQLFPGQEG